MEKISQKITTLKKYLNTHIYLFILAIQSFVIILLSNHYINRDGVTFLKTSLIIANHGMANALKFYDWPTFSILIYLLNKYCMIPYPIAAHFLDVAFVLVTFYFFSKTAKIIFKNINHIDVFSFAVFSSSIPIMDSYLPMILRDPGMWAGAMAGVFYFIRYLESKKITLSLTSIFAFFISGLFRSEGFLFIPFIFILIVFNSRHSYDFLIKEVKNIFFILLFLILVILFTHEALDFNSRFATIIERFYLLFSSHDQVLGSDNYFFKRYLDDNYHLILNISFITVFINKWIFNIGFAHFASGVYFLYHLRNNKFVKLEYKGYLIAFIVYSLFVVFLHFYATVSLSSRYFIFSYLLFYFFSIGGLIKAMLSGKKIIKYIFVFLYIFSFLNTVIDSNNKNIKLQAVSWVVKNIETSQSVISNDDQINFSLKNYDLTDTSIGTIMNNMNYRYVILALDNGINYDFSNFSILKKFNKKEKNIIILKRNNG